ncbi:MAG: GNAT family N-acetyltransferase [Paludibacteraceae bacterium]|nr:GNAT family N-acetyltransferase [Paludibacteraceae bacterium]
MYTNSIFEESWWLDAVAPGHWKELKIEKGGELVARWPIVLYGNKIKIPKYTQTIGIWLNPKYIQTIADEEDVYLQLIEQLPKDVKAEWALAPENRFYLPFVWKGFDVSVGATYVIEDLNDMDAVFSRLSKSMQRDIKQAVKKVSIEESNDIDKLIEMSLATYSRQGRAYIVKPEILRNLFETAKKHNACSLLAAIDTEGNVHSMTLFVFDENKCYYLVGASDPKLNAKSCANTLLLWEGIKIAARHSKVFDFEGSTIQGIGTYFRRFGSKFTYHFVIKKEGLIGELYQMLKPRIKAILGHKK